MDSSNSPETSDWPETWRDFPKEAGENIKAFFADTRAAQPYWESLGVPWATVGEDENGNLEVKSRLRPGQLASKRKRYSDASKVEYVTLTRAISADRAEKPDIETRTQDGWLGLKLKIAPLSEVPTLLAQGWKVENGRLPPLEEGINVFRDNRPYDLPVDVLSRDKPAKDTDYYFEEGKKIWRPGQLVGVNGSDPETIRKSPSFAEWSSEPFSEVRSATSIGHIVKHTAPADVGLGWGDYDLFTKWQSYGREIPKDAVVEKEWSTDPWGPLNFFDESGKPAETFNEPMDREKLPVRNRELKSLYAKLHRKKDQPKDRNPDKVEWPSKKNEL